MNSEFTVFVWLFIGLTLNWLVIVLLAIAVSGVEDVRSVLEYYSHFDDPIAAFKENQRILQVC